MYVHDGFAVSFASSGNGSSQTNKIDWTFTVWDPARWNNLYASGNNTGFSDDPNFGRSLPPPRIDVYPDSTGRVDWNQIRIPARVALHDNYRTDSTNPVIIMQPAGSLVVRVVDGLGRPAGGRDGLPIQISVAPAGGSVLGSWGGTSNSDTNGVCRFEGVHPGNYLIGSSVGEKRYPVEVKPHETNELVIPIP